MTARSKSDRIADLARRLADEGRYLSSAKAGMGRADLRGDDELREEYRQMAARARRGLLRLAREIAKVVEGPA